MPENENKINSILKLASNLLWLCYVHHYTIPIVLKHNFQILCWELSVSISSCYSNVINVYIVDSTSNIENRMVSCCNGKTLHFIIGQKRDETRLCIYSFRSSQNRIGKKKL